MVNAREAAYLTQQQVADVMKVDVKSVNGWEKARTTPYLRQREPLRNAIKFTGTDDELLEVFLVKKPQESMITDSETVNICQEENQSRQMTTPCQGTPNRAIFESTDSIVIHIPGSDKGIKEFMEFARRHFMEVLAQLGLTASFGHLSIGLVSSPIVDPEEYLDLCGESIDTWWQWLNQGNYPKLERVLLKNVPVLKRLAYTDSPFQGSAADLAVQTKIMQIILAMHKLNFAEREIHCAEAVRLGELSGNPLSLATALFWQGTTYISCYHQPQKAIFILKQALSCINDNTLFGRSPIYSGLSIAYAQDNTQDVFEAKARGYAELAHMTMPTFPELDPFFHYFDMGYSELYQWTGRTYLALAGKFPDAGYASNALEAFEKANRKQTMTARWSSQTLIHKADAARALGDMNGCVEDLTDGFHIGDEIKSLKRLIEASDVIGNMPRKWKQETAVQNLQKDVTHALVVARR